MMSVTWLVLVAVSVVAGVEVYHEGMHEGGSSDLGQYDGLAASAPLSDADEQAAAEVLLYQLLAAPHSGKILTFPYRSRWINSEVENKGRLMLPKRWNPSAFDILTDKRSSPENLNGGDAINVATRAQPKWKTKKGPQMMCYFKLCTFRVSY